MQFDASNPDVDFVQCVVCEKAITGGRWYARLVVSDFTVALCCLLCVEVFMKNNNAYRRRLETFDRMAHGA
jgi:hypothetical protein